MPLSIVKLQEFLTLKGFVANKFFIMNGYCFYLEIFCLKTADIFLLYIPSKYNIQINDTIYTFFEWRMSFETTNYLNTIENKDILYDDKLISFYKTYQDIIDLYFFNDSNNLFCFSYDVNVDFEINFPKKFKDYVASL